jgi:hypothetical protein
MKMNHDTGSTSSNEAGQNPMDKLLAKLSEQTAALNKQQDALKSSEDIAYARTAEYVSASATGSTADSELLRLKMELEAAKGKIARQEQELAQSRTQGVDSDFGFNPCKSLITWSGKLLYDYPVLTLASFPALHPPTSICSRQFLGSAR